MSHYLHESLAISTRSTYSSASRSFMAFAVQYHRLGACGQLLPASEDTLMLYTTFLSATLKPQSIKVYLYGVRNLHLQHGHEDPLINATNLQCLLRGIKRVNGVSPDSRLPITPSILHSFALQLHTSYLDHCMLWAALLTAFLASSVAANSWPSNTPMSPESRPIQPFHTPEQDRPVPPRSSGHHPGLRRQQPLCGLGPGPLPCLNSTSPGPIVQLPVRSHPQLTKPA